NTTYDVDGINAAQEGRVVGVGEVRSGETAIEGSFGCHIGNGISDEEPLASVGHGEGTPRNHIRAAYPNDTENKVPIHCVEEVPLAREPSDFPSQAQRLQGLATNKIICVQ